ncbi:hypothetical protein AYO38_05600 [bacterium SCGC AG-212-C10]|nr:hypothetical protein AYO38_05600 [bacterium SCGC AG-212-C10]
MKYQVLVVDNSPDVRERAKDELGSADLSDKVEVVICSGVADAQSAIDKGFFNIAIVDLKLNGNVETGRAVVEHLLAKAPSCEIVVMSRYVRGEPGAVMNLVSPLMPARVSVIEKDPGVNWFQLLVSERLIQWQRRQLAISGLDVVVTELLKSERAKRLRLAERANVGALAAELHGLFSDIFGERLPAVGMRANRSLHLEQMHRGFSASVVVEAVPSLGTDEMGSDVVGNRCIVKIGRRDDVAAEADRFLRVVRFGIPLESRVELLDFSLGDKLGVICYSFAGGANTRVRSLDEVVRSSSGGLTNAAASRTALKCVSTLFQVDTRQWYQVAGELKSIGEYFEATLQAKLLGRDRSRSERLERVANELGGVYERAAGRMRFGATVLKFPTSSQLGSGVLAKRFPTSLVHGDMHGGNIMLDAHDRIRLIDFAQAGFGARTIDAAVLHGSVRIWDCAKMPSGRPLEKWLSGRISREHSLWDAKHPSSGGSGWERVARSLNAGVRDNFRLANDEELMITCFLQGTRLLSIPTDDPRVILRIGAWLTPLVEWLDRTDKER